MGICRPGAYRLYLHSATLRLYLHGAGCIRTEGWIRLPEGLWTGVVYGVGWWDKLPQMLAAGARIFGFAAAPPVHGLKTASSSYLCYGRINDKMNKNVNVWEGNRRRI